MFDFCNNISSGTDTGEVACHARFVPDKQASLRYSLTSRTRPDAQDVRRLDLHQQLIELLSRPVLPPNQFAKPSTFARG